jgi:hypothetical protein
MNNKLKASSALLWLPLFFANCGKFDVSGDGGWENACTDVGKALVAPLGVTEFATQAWYPPAESFSCVHNTSEFRESVHVRLDAEEGNYRVEVRSNGGFQLYWGLDEPSQRDSACLCTDCLVHCEGQSTISGCRELGFGGAPPLIEAEAGGLGGDAHEESASGAGGRTELISCDWLVLPSIPVVAGRDTKFHVVTKGDATWLSFRVVKQ